MDKELDFFAIPQSLNYQQRLNGILDNFLSNQDNLPWKEIATRSGPEPRLSVLMQAASELASTESNSLFRKNDRADVMVTSLWLSYVLNKARMEVVKYPEVKFNELSADSIREIAILSRNPENICKIQVLLREKYGILLIIERAFKGMNLDGVVTKISDGLPVIGLSVRYSRYDYFWFTLVHELAHIYLHYESLDEPICDDLDEKGESTDIEAEANRFATDSLIPRRLWAKANVKRSLTEADLFTLARDAQIHPAIAAGILRKHTGNYRIFSGIVNKIDTRTLLGV